MRRLLLLTVLAGTLLFFSCRKSGKDGRSSLVELKSCTRTNVSGDRVTICFDSLLTDSRCPANANCGTPGYAIIQMTLSVKGQQQSFKISTVDLPPQYGNDAKVLGYKVKLINLAPYPGTGSTEPYNAEVEITR